MIDLNIARIYENYLNMMVVGIVENRFICWKSCVRIWYTLACLFIISDSICSQAILLVNPSFEDTPSDATTPMGWMECEEFTTPDILPGYWGVYDDASDGDTYVGMITRENGSFEAIGQRMSSKLITGECYGFTVDVAHSNKYAGYNDQIKFKVWISDRKCRRQQLIYESATIKEIEWETITIEFTPKTATEYITIEAVRSTDTYQKGNILLDNITPILMCNRV